jgi:hypothetical protein
MQSHKQEKSAVMRWPEQARIYRILCTVLLSLMAVVTGCGGHGITGNNGIGSVSQYNTYAGTQSLILGTDNGPLEGGVWSLTLDDANSFFSYSDLADPNLGTSIGNFTSVNGFLDMTLDGGSKGSGGYAVEIPGNAMMFRPGNGSNYLAVGAASNSCASPQANTTYQFVFLAHPLGGYMSTSASPAYGSIQASAQGTAWSFSNFNEYTVGGTSLSPAAMPSGTCAYTPTGYVVSIPSSNAAAGDSPFTVAVGPTGYFMADLGQNGLNPVSGGAYGFAGTVRPSSQLTTSDVVAGKYIGFQYVSFQATLNYLGSPISLGSVTSPMAFGQTAGSGTTMTGGVYPNDDVTQPPPSNITINLGQQDSQNNGLYKSVTVTIPDPTGACVARPYGSKDANGNPICVFAGVAVVGNPGGKYAVFVTANDERPLSLSYPATSALEYFLYQQ